MPIIHGFHEFSTASDGWSGPVPTMTSCSRCVLSNDSTISRQPLSPALPRQVQHGLGSSILARPGVGNVVAAAWSAPQVTMHGFCACCFAAERWTDKGF